MKIINAFQHVFARHPKKLISSGMLLTGLGGLYLYIISVDINDDPRLFFHVSPTLLAQEREIASLTQIYEPGRYLVVEGKTSAQIYQGLEAYYDELRPQSNQVMSVLDWAPSLSTQQQNYALQEILYMNDGVIDAFYQLLGLDISQSQAIKTDYEEAQYRFLDFPALLNNLPSLPPLWIEHKDNIYSFVLIKKNSDLEGVVAASQGISNIRYINTLGAATEALKAQRITGTKLLLAAYALIALMLVLNYRQLSAIFLILIPLAASIITLSVLAAIGQPINVFHIMALFLVLGLGMDYIIFAKEMTDRQNITQQAILLSAATSLLSFGLLAFSSMPIVQAFGSTILIGNSINFIAAISLFNKQSKQVKI